MSVGFVYRSVEMLPFSIKTLTSRNFTKLTTHQIPTEIDLVISGSEKGGCLGILSYWGWFPRHYKALLMCVEIHTSVCT